MNKILPRLHAKEKHNTIGSFVSVFDQSRKL